MKIRKVKWKGHPILGDLELDFVNPNTKMAYDTIVLAGENGSGKTTIIDTLNDFLCVGPINIFEYIEYEVGGKSYRVKYCPKDTIVNGEKYFDIYDEGGKIIKKSVPPLNIEKEVLDPRHYGCAFSRAGINYKTKKISTSTSLEVDTDKYDRGDKDNAVELKQLIVDLGEQYKEEHFSWFERQKREGKSTEDDSEVYGKSKIKRFKDAFNNFFENIKYDKVETEDGEKKVIFNKEGKEITIDSLSTGEKQIVFRGAQLLKNVNKIGDGIVMIDEPEISMHPKWQQKIMSYYRDLFKKEGNPIAQLFFATHSEHVVSSAMKDKENTLVIVLKEDSGCIDNKKITAPVCLSTITSAEINYIAFGIPTVDYHQQLYAEIQKKAKSTLIKDCDSYIKNQAIYDMAKHGHISQYNSTTYETICTFVRNRIDHPDPNNSYTDAQLALSIDLMQKILI